MDDSQNNAKDNGLISNQKKVSEKSLANLRPVKKGEVRNPNGRRNDCWRDIENKLLSASKIDFQIETISKNGSLVKMKIYVDVGSKESFRYALTARKIQLGLSGDIAAIKDLQDRDMGKAKEHIEHTVVSTVADELTDKQKAALADKIDTMLTSRENGNENGATDSK
jgi:hypothetical protein